MMNKKAFNGDGYGIILLVVILGSISFAVPLVASAIGSETTSTNIDGIRDTAQENSGSISILTAGSILLEVVTFGLFDWGNALDVPIWVSFLFTLLAVALLVLIVRTVRGVG